MLEIQDLNGITASRGLGAATHLREEKMRQTWGLQGGLRALQVRMLPSAVDSSSFSHMLDEFASK